MLRAAWRRIASISGESGTTSSGPASPTMVGPLVMPPSANRGRPPEIPRSMPPRTPVGAAIEIFGMENRSHVVVTCGSIALLFLLATSMPSWQGQRPGRTRAPEHLEATLFRAIRGVSPWVPSPYGCRWTGQHLGPLKRLLCAAIISFWGPIHSEAIRLATPGRGSSIHRPHSCRRLPPAPRPAPAPTSA